jgi:hypothetical protein
MGPRARDRAAIALGYDGSAAVQPMVNIQPIRMDRGEPSARTIAYLGGPDTPDIHGLGGAPACHLVPAAELLVPTTELLVPTAELLVPAAELLVPTTELLVPTTELLVPTTELLVAAAELLVPTIA